MNASLWQLAGWTMIHSLWLGAAVALAGGFLRLACRRAAPNTRYAISLATLAALAATPLATAAWLSVIGVPQLAANLESPLLPLPLGESWGEGQNPLSTTPPANATVENPSPGPSLQGRGIEGTPGRMPGLSGQVIDLAHATPAELDAIAAQHNPAQALPTNSQPTFPLPPSTLPLPTTYSPTHLLTYSLRFLPTLWLIGAPLTFTLLATGLVGSERLRRRATPLLAGSAFDACQRLRHTLNITRRVALAASDGVAQPILVGIVRPLILLPTAALAGWTPEQLDMVLLHELAHVRRWDNLVNLLQRIVESLLFYHPAVWLLSRQVRRDREECCDAAVIRHTDRPHQYAELLVSIAAALRGGPAPSLAVASAMASHPLAGRIRRILNLEEEPMRITRRTLAATLLLPLLLAGAIFYSGASAQDPPPSQGAEQPSTLASGERAQGGSLREAIRGGISDASNSKTPNSEEKRGDEPSQASPSNDDPETAAPLIRKIYPIKPGTLIDPLKLAEAIEDGVEMQTIKSRDSDSTELSIIISAPQKTHDRVHALLSQAQSLPRGNQGIGTVDIPQLQNEIRNLESQIAKSREELTSIEVFKEMAVQNSQKNDALIEEAVRKELEADQKLKILNDRLLNIERFIADEELNNAKGSANDDGETIKSISVLRETTEAKRDAYLAEATKAVRERIAKLPNETLRAAVTEYKIRRKAAEENLARYQQELTAAQANLSQLGAVGNSSNQAQASAQASSAASADEGAPRTDVHLASLQSEIRKLEAIVARAQEEVVNLEVYKQIGGHGRHPGSSELELAIAKEVEKDPTVNELRQRIFEQQMQLQAQLAESENPNAPGIKKLRSAVQHAEAELAKHAQKLTKATREKLSHIPNKAKEKAEAEYNTRYEAAKDNLGKHQRELAAARARLSQVVPTAPAGAPGSPNQGGAATGSNVENAPPRNLAPFKGMKEISVPFPFSPSEEDYNRIRKSLEANGFKVISATFDSIDRADGRRPPSLSVFVPSDWHAAPVWETLADGKKTLRIVNFAGAPGSPNQGGAATGSNANDAQPTANASPGSAAPVQEPEPPATPAGSSQEGLKQVLSDASSRLRHEIFDLKKRAAEASGTESEAEIAAALEQKVQQWRALAGSPGSPNQGGAATGSNANNAQPTANASPGAAAPVQEPEAPSSPFPTLENQKIADRAYKLLGLELELADGADLERIKKLGYDGGFRIVGTDDNKYRPGSWGPETLLVGLHVWPTHNLKSLDEVLTRDDLDALSPLKYHVIVKTATKETMDSAKPVMVDYLYSDRIPIDVSAWETERNLSSKADAGAPGPPNQGAAATRSNADNTPPTAKASAPVQEPGPIAKVSLMQAPMTVVTGTMDSRGNGRMNSKPHTNAYLKLAFTPSQGAHFTPEEIDRAARDYIALAASPTVLQAALKSTTIRDLPTIKEAQDAPTWLSERLSVTRPGNGDTLKFKLENDGKPGDEAILQAVIDAFIAAMKTPPESPADPNAASDSAADAPGDLSQYVGSAADNPAVLNPSDSVVLNVAGAFPEAPLDDVFVIEPEGTLALGPLYGRVAVAGQTLLEAEATVKEHLSKTLTDVAVQLTLAPNQPTTETSPPPTALSPPTFLYDGKTFDQWRDLWKLELNPERRTEAINALAAFTRAGRGDEAINAILDVAAEYDFDRMDDTKPEGKLKLRVIEALAPEDAANAVDQWLPLLLDRLKSSPQKWDPLLIQLLARTGPPYRESFALSPENLGLLKQTAADPAYGPNARLVNHLYWSAPEDEEVAQLVKATLAGADAANAVELLRNIGYRRIEEYPEKLDLLFHPAPAIRRSARTALNHSLDPGTHDAVAAKLLAIVADPKQADRHADAIRAIAAIVKRAAEMPKTLSPTLSQKTIQAIADGLTPILAEGSAELIPPAYLVADKVRRIANFKNKLTDFLTYPPEERKAPVEAALKASQDEEATLIDQPEHSGNMDGKGGGFF